MALSAPPQKLSSEKKENQSAHAVIQKKVDSSQVDSSQARAEPAVVSAPVIKEAETEVDSPPIEDSDPARSIQIEEPQSGLDNAAQSTASDEKSPDVNDKLEDAPKPASAPAPAASATLDPTVDD